MSYQIPPNVCFIDIETLPDDASVGMDLTRAPGAAAHDSDLEVRLHKWRRHSLDPLAGRVGLITIATGEAGVHVIDAADDERAGLTELKTHIDDHYNTLRGPYDIIPTLVWVGHNGISFDFPFLQIRALKHGLPLLAAEFHQDRPWDGTLIDTLRWWPQMGSNGRPRGTLDAICAHLGIERTDNPIDGSQVLDAYVSGHWADVVAHGVADVRDLREVYRVLAQMRGA